MVVFFNAEAVGNIQWLNAAEYRCAGIALFLSAVPILLITGQIKDCLIRLHLGFLQAEHIGVQLAE